MRTKQEQIEEMKREIENGFRKADCREAYTNKPYPYFETQKIAIAEALYNAGYRKVLIDTENGEAVDCVQCAPWQLIEGYTEREVEKARKDTAKAILNVLYFNLQNSMKGQIAKSNDDYNVMGRIQEIAKNYGVEAEE